MSKEINISINNYNEGKKIFKKLRKGHENLINFRKKKLFKRTQLINCINDYYKQANNFHYLLNKKESNKGDSFSNINTDNFSIIKKPNYIDKSKNIITLGSDKINKSKKKMKISHLFIDSYDKKVKFSLPVNLKNNVNKIEKTDYKNKTDINFRKKEEKKEGESDFRKFKNHLKRLSTDIKLNINKDIKNERSKSISFNIKNNDNSNKFTEYFRLASKLKKNRKTQILIDRINTINTTSFDLKKKKNKNIKIKKQKSELKNKYSVDFVKDSIYRQILNNPNLKILYQTNENRIKKMIKSQSKRNKKKLTILKYQNNLMNNSISPLNDEQKFRIMKSFSKINNYCATQKIINLQKYLNEIQNKEKKIINFHNNLNQRYITNIKKIGLSPKKHLYKMEKVSFKDIFKNKKSKT